MDALTGNISRMRNRKVFAKGQVRYASRTVLTTQKHDACTAAIDALFDHLVGAGD